MYVGDWQTQNPRTQAPVSNYSIRNILKKHTTPKKPHTQLAREDHRWWWRSFLNGGATGLFILAYSFFYYFQRSEMDGFFQVCCVVVCHVVSCRGGRLVGRSVGRLAVLDVAGCAPAHTCLSS